MSTIEALGWWLADQSQAEARGPFVETRVLLDRETNQQILYLSKRFGVPKTTLIRKLLQAAARDVFAVIPGDPPPYGLIRDPGGASGAPDAFRWFDLQSIREDEEREERQALRFSDLIQEVLDEETAERIWRGIRKDAGLQDPGADDRE